MRDDAVHQIRCQEPYLVSVIKGKRGLIPSLLRAGLVPLSMLYLVGLKLYLLLYKLGIRRSARLNAPVICVGNLTTGGTGKTPTVQAICRMLLEDGKRVVILNRGYGGAHEYHCAVVSDGNKVSLNALEAGDEAYLLARSLPDAPVIVGKDRILSGTLACEQFLPDIVLMDDGMQHWRLHRNLDIVLLDACNPFDNGWSVPRGLLREPPSHLRRAGIIVLTNAKRAGSERIAALTERIGRLATGTPIFTANLLPVSLSILNSNEAFPLDWLVGRRVMALSALGNPISFESSLVTSGAELVSRVRFPDHQHLHDGDLAKVFSDAVSNGAEAIIITEKDAVKMPITVTPVPVMILQAAMQFDDPVGFFTLILQRSFN